MLFEGTALVTFMLATLAVMATPGVTVSALTGTTLSHGSKLGFAMEAGAVLGRLSMIAILALGLDFVSQFMLVVFDWVKLAGAAYLIWLGIKSIRHPPHLTTTAAVAPQPRRQVLNGFIVLWSNPKALIFFGAFLPQFVDPAENVIPQVLFLGLIWVLTALITDSCYIVLAGSARRLFAGKFAQRTGIVSGTILIGAGIWLALQQKA